MADSSLLFCLQVYLQEVITDHSQGMKHSLSTSLGQVMQDAVRPGQAEILAKLTVVQAQSEAMQAQLTDVQAQSEAMQAQSEAMQAQLTDVQTQSTAMQAQSMAMFQNIQIQAGNDNRHASQGRLRLLRKTFSGHLHGKRPQDKALVDLVEPVPVGRFPPDLDFFPQEGLTSDKIMCLTNSQVNDLAWFYNEDFIPSKYEWR